jgi:hypothetical protein
VHHELRLLFRGFCAVKWPKNSYHAWQKRMIEGLHSTGPDLDRKFWPAMGLFAVLAVVVWFTLGEGTTLVSGKPVAIRTIVLLVIGLFVFRTVMAREADKIRRRKLGEQELAKDGQQDS